MPHLALWQWLLGAFNAFTLGAAKTGVPGGGTLVIPLMVLLVGNARYAAAWTAPMLSTGDVFAVFYWRRHADAKKLFSLIPWVAIGMVGGSFALNLNEHLLRRIVGSIVGVMLVLFILQRRRGSIVWMVTRHELSLLSCGLALGLPLAIAGSQIAQSLFFGVTASDPTTIGAAALAMTVVGLLASLVPTRRAAMVQPTEALRRE